MLRAAGSACWCPSLKSPWNWGINFLAHFGAHLVWLLQACISHKLWEQKFTNYTNILQESRFLYETWKMGLYCDPHSPIVQLLKWHWQIQIKHQVCLCWKNVLALLCGDNIGSWNWKRLLNWAPEIKTSLS